MREFLTMEVTTEMQAQWNVLCSELQDPAKVRQRKTLLMAQRALQRTINLLTLAPTLASGIGAVAPKSLYSDVAELIEGRKQGANAFRPTDAVAASGSGAAAQAAPSALVIAVQQLQRMVVSYYMFGSRIYYPVAAVERFINHSICHLDHRGGDQKGYAFITEPMVQC